MTAFPHRPSPFVGCAGESSPLNRLSRCAGPRGEEGKHPSGLAWPAVSMPAGGGEIDDIGDGRVGVFGGTFDPVHVGHLIVAADLRFALGLDRLLFVPAGRPPHKPADLVSDDEDRLAMLELALADDPEAEISRVDMERVGPSYTAEMLAILHARMPAARLVFLMGEDSLRDLPTWRGPEEIARLAELGVATRPGVEFDPEAIYREVPAARGRVRLVETVQLSVSSSDIRRRVREGRPIRYQVPVAVEGYISERGLYR